MRRTLAALALSSSLVLAGCQNPDGSTDWGSTLALGAGAGLAAALVAGAASDQPRPYYGGRRGRGHGQYRSHPQYGGWHGYYGQPYRGGW